MVNKGTAATVETLALVLGDRYGTKIEPSHFRRATETELSEWMGRVGRRQPPGMRGVNEAVLKTTANQEGGVNAFLVRGFEHASISDIVVTSVQFRLRVNISLEPHIIHHGWWVINDSAAGEEEGAGICFYEYGPGSYLDASDETPTSEQIATCFCLQECVDCNSVVAGVDHCEGACN